MRIVKPLAAARRRGANIITEADYVGYLETPMENQLQPAFTYDKLKNDIHWWRVESNLKRSLFTPPR